YQRVPNKIHVCIFGSSVVKLHYYLIEPVNEYGVISYHLALTLRLNDHQNLLDVLLYNEYAEYQSYGSHQLNRRSGTQGLQNLYDKPSRFDQVKSPLASY